MSALCQGQHCRPEDHGGPRRAVPGWPLCDLCEERVAENLRAIAEIWPETEEALHLPEVHDSRRAPGPPAARLPLNTHVAEVRATTLTTLAYWAQVVVEESWTLTAPPFDLEHLPALARWLAQHTRRLTRNYDQGVCISISTDAHDLHRQLRHAAYPSGGRRFPGRADRQLPCVEHTVDENGQRIPCPGVYSAWLTEGMDHVPDLRCSVDPTHVLSPAGFRRLGRRAELDEHAARRFVATIVEAG